MKRYLLEIIDNPIFFNFEASNLTKGIALSLAFVAVSTKLGFMPLWMQTLYYAFCIIAFLFIFINCRGEFNIRFAILYLVLVINVIILPIDPVFNSKMRLMLFILVTVVCSSAIVSKEAILFRHFLFKYIIMFFSFLVPLSCVCRFIGINFVRMSTNGLSVEEQISRTGLFGGLFQHSMTLGPIAALTAISFYYGYLKDSNKKIYLVLFLMSALACFFSASRGSILSLIVPVALSLLSKKDNVKTKKNIRNILILSCLIVFPFSDFVLKGVVEKQERNVEMGSTFGSRIDKFDARLAEFNSSPILGVGFASIDPLGSDEYGNDGTIEPGSSHLAVLSMTGIVGMFCYLSIIFFAYSSIKTEKNIIVQYRKSLLIAILLHGCWEGYVFSGGGFLCFLYWLIFSQCIDYRYIKKYKLNTYL